MNTDLAGVGLHTHGEPLDEFADGIFEGIEDGTQEIGFNTSVELQRMSRDKFDKHIANMYNAMKNII